MHQDPLLVFMMVRPSDLYNGNPYSQNDVFILNRAQNSLNSLRPTWPSDTYLCIGNLTIIGSDNGLSPGWCQANIWTNAGILLIGPLGTHFSEILIEIYTFSFKKMHFKQSFVKWQPFCLWLNVLMKHVLISLINMWWKHVICRSDLMAL